MERDEWDTHEARTEAMTRLVSYMDSLQSGYDQGSVGIELTQGMLDRIARELGLEGRIQHAVKDRSKTDTSSCSHSPEKVPSEGFTASSRGTLTLRSGRTHPLLSTRSATVPHSSPAYSKASARGMG